MSPFNEYEWVGTNATWNYLATSTELARSKWIADRMNSSLYETIKGTRGLAQTIFYFTLSHGEIY